jgi:hypothetical protein
LGAGFGLALEVSVLLLQPPSHVGIQFLESFYGAVWATEDEKVGGALRAAIFFSDQTFLPSPLGQRLPHLVTILIEGPRLLAGPKTINADRSARAVLHA